jgi:ABC-2 type transport system permease protein
MRPTLVLLRKSLLNFRRARAALVITFLVPVVLIYLFGHVFGLYRKDPGPSGIRLAVVNESPEPAARDLVAALQAEKTLQIITTARAADGTTHALTEAEARQALEDNTYRFVLLLPPDLVSASRFGIRLKFLTNPRNEIEAQTVYGLLQKTVFAHVPQLLGQSLQATAREHFGAAAVDRFNGALADAVSSNFGGDRTRILHELQAGNLLASTGRPPPVADPSLRRLDTPAATSVAAAAPAQTRAPAPGTDFFSRLISFETEQVAGKDVKSPMATRIVGGYAIMFLLFAVSASSASIFEERKSGVLQRLLSSPVRPSHILWARFLFGLLLGLAQITALFLAGRLFFGLEIFDRAGALFCVALSAAAACSAFGMLVAALAPSQEAANGLSTFLVISMSAIGGAWFPVSFMPEYIQTVSKLTLVYWSVEGFTDVLWAGRSLLQVAPKIGILAGMAALVMSVAVWRFNRSRFFE